MANSGLRHNAVLSFFLRAAFVALGLWLATRWVDGLYFDSAQTLILAALLLGVINAVVKPLVLILTLPITLVTLGFFLLIINAAMLSLVAALVQGFNISSFGSAFWASLLVSLFSWLANGLLGGIKVHMHLNRRD